MFVRIDPSVRTPLFEQVAASVRGSVARGELEAGERLPSARELAASLDINLHTVLRAYQLLRDEGLLELRRGRGAVIARNASDTTEFNDAVDRVVEYARTHGMTTEELIAQIRERSAR